MMVRVLRRSINEESAKKMRQWFSLAEDQLRQVDDRLLCVCSDPTHGMILAELSEIRCIVGSIRREAEKFGFSAQSTMPDQTGVSA